MKMKTDQSDAPEAREHQILPAKPQELGVRHGTLFPTVLRKN